MSSGVQIDDECTTAYEEFKKRASDGHFDYRYVIFKLSKDLKKIEVAQRGNREKTFDDFASELDSAMDEGEARYAVYNLEGRANSQPAEKLLFIYCTDDTKTSIKNKMTSASSKQALMNKLNFTGTQFQWSDHSERHDYDAILKSLKFDPVDKN